MKKKVRNKVIVHLLQGRAVHGTNPVSLNPCNKVAATGLSPGIGESVLTRAAID